MITATWRGIRPPEIGEMRSPSYSAATMGDGSSVPVFWVALDVKEFALFALALRVHEGDVLVRQALQFLFVSFEVVL